MRLACARLLLLAGLAMASTRDHTALLGRQLSDADFEHTTQAATGQTTGAW